MNENNQLDENETLLLMRDGRSGKTVGGTRVFKDVASFATWLRADSGDGHGNWRNFFEYKVAGDIVRTGKIKRVVASPGYVVRDWKYLQVYVASNSDAPRRIKVKPQMVGFEEPEYA